MKFLLTLVFLTPLLAVTAAAECSLTTSDQTAIAGVMEKYRTSWLKSDAAGVLSTFSEDAVLLPHHGGAPVEGIKAIKAFWWPVDAPATSLTKLEITAEKFGGNCHFAFVRGRDSVAWSAQEEGKTVSYSNSGTYLNVMKKLKDRSWRIWQHMWDDPGNMRTLLH